MLHEQATRLASRGHSVQVLTRKLPFHSADHAEIDGVREWRYEVNRHSAYAFLASTLRNGKKLFEEIDRSDHLHCINFQQPFSSYAVMQSPACRKTRKVYTCFSFAFEEYTSRNARPASLLQRPTYWLHRMLRKWMEKKALQRADCIVALSRFTVDKLCDVYGYAYEDISIVPGGIDLVRFHPAADKKEVREKLRLPKGVKIVFTVRNLVPRMGLDNLIRALRLAIDEFPDLYLVVGGTGPLREELTGLCRRLGLERVVHFAGFIPEEILPDYYRAADLFVLPTVELEGFGLVTVESLASGTPVLGTPIGATSEILGKLGNDFLFANTTPEAMAHLIIEKFQIYQDRPDQWLSDSRRCRLLAETDYSWDANVKAMEKIFRGDLS